MKPATVLLVAPAIEELRLRAGEKPRWVTKVFRHNQQLGLLYVASSMPPGTEVRVIDEHVEPLDFDAPVDLVGITCMTPHAPRAYEIADRFRARGVKVMLGGYHPTFMPEEARQHADAVCVGEAETVVPQMMADFARGRLTGIYRGGQPSLSALPIPDRGLIQRDAYIRDAIQASRGCPNACHYCSDTAFFGYRHRTRPVRAVVEELAQLGKHVIFLDSNIVGDRDHAKRLFQAMKPLGRRWVSQCSLRIAEDDELLQLAADSGCRGLFIGLETVDQHGLDQVNKRVATVATYEDRIKRIHDRGIGICAGLIFGLDSDTPDVFQRTLDFVLRTRVESINPFIMTPFPGTRLHRTMCREGRILTTDWSKYDFTHVVVRPKQMTVDQLRDGREFLLREFYTGRRALGRVVRAVLTRGVEVALASAVPFNAAYWYVARQYRRRRDREMAARRRRGRIAERGPSAAGEA